MTLDKDYIAACDLYEHTLARAEQLAAVAALIQAAASSEDIGDTAIAHVAGLLAELLREQGKAVAWLQNERRAAFLKRQG